MKSIATAVSYNDMANYMNTNQISKARITDSIEVDLFNQKLLSAVDPQLMDEYLANLTTFQVFGDRQIDELADIFTETLLRRTGASKAFSANADPTHAVNNTDLEYETVSQVIVQFAQMSHVIERVVKKWYQAGQGMDLINYHRQTIIRSNSEGMNATALFGNANLGAYGIFTHPNIPAQAEVASARDWTDAATTREQIRDDILAGREDIITRTNGEITPNICILSPKMYSALYRKENVYIGNGLISELSAQGIDFYNAFDLKGANGVGLFGGTKAAPYGTKDGFILCDRNKIKHLMPANNPVFTDIQREGVAYKFWGLQWYGGLYIPQPLGVGIYYNGTQTGSNVVNIVTTKDDNKQTAKADNKNTAKA